MRKIRFIFMVFLVAVIIPTQASAAWEGQDHVPLSTWSYNATTTFLTKTGYIKACVSSVDNSNNTYTIDAYEDDGGSYGLTKLGATTLKGNSCYTFPTKAVADGTNGYAEVYIRVGNALYSDDRVQIDVYLQ